MRTKDYFNQVSGSYIENISHGPVGRLKVKEKECILRMISPYKDSSVLDAGCGPGYYAIELKKMGCSVFGIDFSPKMVEETLRKGVQAEVHDIESFSLNMKFDIVLCAGVAWFQRQNLYTVFIMGMQSCSGLPLAFPE